MIPVPLLATCLFGNGDLMMTTGAKSSLKNIFAIGDQFDIVGNKVDQLSVCPFVFFFKSQNIALANTDGYEDIYRE